MTAEAFRETITRTITLSKQSGRTIYEVDLDKQVSAILAAVQTKAVIARGWRLAIERQPAARWSGDTRMVTFRDKSDAIGNGHTYSVLIKATCTLTAPRGVGATEAEFNAIVANMAHSGRKPNWKIGAVDGQEWAPVERLQTHDGLPKPTGDGAELVGYAPFSIPADFETYFTDASKGGGLYGLDAHIARVKSALQAAERSMWQQRFHVMLAGPPGCGKTHMCRALKRALGESAVLEFDGTSTTKAGAEKELLERVEMPRVLLIEEAEKIASPEVLDYMLGLLDMRSEIRKTTARSTVQRDIRMLAICTVNDVELFQKLRSGALYSRFTNRVYFSRPSHAMLSAILKREIDAIGGDHAWIEPAIAFADEQGLSDPRAVQAIGLCGADGLLDGSYQAAVRATTAAAAGLDV